MRPKWYMYKVIITGTVVYPFTRYGCFVSCARL